MLRSPLTLLLLLLRPLMLRSPLTLLLLPLLPLRPLMLRSPLTLLLLPLRPLTPPRSNFSSCKTKPANCRLFCF